MQLASVLLARYYGLFQVEDLNRGGTVYFPEVGRALVERYSFAKYPTKPEEFDESKGVEFLDGRLGKQVIEKLVILESGIYLDTQADTDVSEKLWYDLMEWAVTTLGVTFRRDMVKRHVYVSNLTFYSDAPFLELNPVFNEIQSVVSSEVEKSYRQRLDYVPAAISITYDQLETKLGTAPFTVQRREGVPFEQNKYFSTAPIKTDIHLYLLEKWESAVRR